MKEFLALAKSKPKELNYASSGPGTPYHMAIDQFDKFLREDITKWAGVVKATGMKVD